MTFAGCLKRAIVTYRRALLDANGPAVDTSRDAVSNGRGGHGKHGARTVHLTFGRDLPLSVEMERSLARWCDVWGARLDPADPTRSAPGAKTGKAKRVEDRAILDGVGQDPTALAFIYGRTTEAVRKLRGRDGMDPDTGERLRRTGMLTEHPRETFTRHESAGAAVVRGEGGSSPDEIRSTAASCGALHTPAAQRGYATRFRSTSG